MSWSASIGPTSQAGWDAAVRDLVVSPESGDYSRRLQVDAAKKVLAILGAEAFAAQPHEYLSASVSGHAEPTHPAREGWSDDYLSVKVSCECKAVAAKAAAEAKQAEAEAAKAAKSSKSKEPAPA